MRSGARVAILVTCLLAFNSIEALAQERFSGAGRRATLDCRGGTIAIVGHGNSLNIRGPCRKIDLTGTGNALVIESVVSIEISGAKNHVTWLHEQDGRPPRVSRTGSDNTVVRANPPRATRAGDVPSPSADETGAQATWGADAIELLSDDAQPVIECHGQPVAVLGSRNSVTLRGRCPLVRVSGDGNTLLVDNPDAIVVTGDGNLVGWRSARLPRVTDTGRRNNVGPMRP